MTIDVIISIDQNIHDPLTMGQTSVVTDIFNISANVINNGGRVLVQQQYENANPETLAIFTKLDELASWRERLNQVQLKLGRENI